MKTFHFPARRFFAAFLIAALAFAPMLAEAYGRGGHWHGRGGGWGWGPAFGVGLGVNLALGSPYYYDYGYGSPYGSPYGYYPRTVIVAPPPRVVVEAEPAVTAAPPAPPEPVIYPRNEQTAAQTEADMRACNSWATTQPKAVADASVFHRAVAACMDGRGYSIR